MLTRASVHCADRMVAQSSSNALPMVERAPRVGVRRPEAGQDLRRRARRRRASGAPGPLGRGAARLTIARLPPRGVGQELVDRQRVEHVGRRRATPSAPCRPRTPRWRSRRRCARRRRSRSPRRAARARRSERQSRSSRCGSALISSATPVAAAFSITASRSRPYGSRESSSRPVGWPMIVRCGLSIAASMRAGHLALAHVEPAVDRGDHEVEPRQHRLVEIDPAVLQDVGLDPLEHPDALEPRVDRRRSRRPGARGRRARSPPAYAAAWLWSVMPT